MAAQPSLGIPSPSDSPPIQGESSRRCLALPLSLPFPRLALLPTLGAFAG